jgi:nitric oxide reductase subunit B
MATMDRTARLWIALGVVLVGAFTLLGVFGREVYRQAPPIPERVLAENGQLLMSKADILRGQRVWQSIGGQQVGSIWGHGAYQAPDWSADWLHREASALLDGLAAEMHGQPFADLGADAQAAMKERVRREMRSNRYDASTGTLLVSNLRAQAMAGTAAHYQALFGDDAALSSLRQAYALQANAIPDAAERQAMTAFFFWTAWSCTTERPGLAVTYTNNWPHDELVGNHPTSANLLWSMISIVLLIAGVGALVWYKAFRERSEEPPVPAENDPLRAIELTPSMRAVWKYAAVVIGLFVLQVLTGALTAHYTVEGQSFFGIPIARYLPYSVTRTWHLQLAVFWIATAFLAAGLFLAPAVGGKEPKYQRLGVHVLFGALLVVVLGSLAGEWLSVQRHLGLDTSFWFGHQGYEYVDLGRKSVATPEPVGAMARQSASVAK